MRSSIVGSRRLIIPDGCTDDAVSATFGPDATLDPSTSSWTSTVHDSADLGLARRGITVERVRRSRGAGCWTVQLPLVFGAPRGAGPLLERRWSGSGTMPGELAAAVAPLVGGPVEIVATTRTTRRALTAGDRSATIDVVELLDETRPSAAVRVLSLDGRVPLAALTELGLVPLTAASPAAHLIGERSLADPAPVGPAIDRTSSARDLVVAALLGDLHLLLHHWPLLHLAPSARTVHSSRVAVRRYRSRLRLFRPILDEHRRVELDAALRGFADALAPLRELDVLCELAGDLALGFDDADRAAVSRLIDRVALGREDLVRGLDDTLADPAALDAVRAAAAFAIDPPVVARADEPARSVVTDLARRSWRRLSAAAVTLDAASPADELHRLRLLAKRARYASEVAGRVRPAAARHAVELRRLQRLLGDLNDVEVATRQLRALALDADGEVAYVAGRLVGQLHQRGERRRADWPAQWQRAKRKGVRRWLAS